MFAGLLCVVLSVWYSVFGIAWTATVGPSSSSATCQKQARSVWAGGERGLCITSHIHTHHFLPSPPLLGTTNLAPKPSANRRSTDSKPSGSRLQICTLTPLLTLHAVAVSPPYTSVLTQAMLRLDGIWIGTLCEKDWVRRRGLSQFPLKNSRHEPGENIPSQTNRCCYCNTNLILAHSQIASFYYSLPSRCCLCLKLFDKSPLLFSCLPASICTFSPYFSHPFISTFSVTFR